MSGHVVVDNGFLSVSGTVAISNPVIVGTTALITTPITVGSVLNGTISASVSNRPFVNFGATASVSVGRPYVNFAGTTTVKTVTSITNGTISASVSNRPYVNFGATATIPSITSIANGTISASVSNRPFVNLGDTASVIVSSITNGTVSANITSIANGTVSASISNRPYVNFGSTATVPSITSIAHGTVSANVMDKVDFFTDTISSLSGWTALTKANVTSINDIYFKNDTAGRINLAIDSTASSFPIYASESFSVDNTKFTNVYVNGVGATTCSYRARLTGV
jgi:hypothetical protein